MRFQRPTPIRGLLAGLLALVAFASFAVAMTTGGSSNDAGNLTPAARAQSVVVAADGETGRGRRFDGDGRIAVRGDGDAGGRTGRR